MKKKSTQRISTRQRRDVDRLASASYSYHTQRSARPDTSGRQSSSLAEKRSRLLSLRFWIKRSGLLAVITVAVVCLVSIVSLSAKPRIVLLDSGNTYAFQEAATYEAAATKQLGSSIWNRNKITINTGSVAQALQQQFPELAEVSITLPLVGHRPIIYLQASEPAFVIQTLNGSFVLDANGKALVTRASAPESTVSALTTITDQSGTTAELGKQIISSANVSFIQTVVASLRANNLVVASLTLPVGNVQQLDVTVQGQPYAIKFDMHDSGGARQQVGTYLALAKTLADQGITPVQYVDVRVLGRAYYL